MRKLANASEEPKSWRTKGKGEQRQSKVLKEKPQLLGTNPDPKQKLSVRSMARVGPFVKSR